MWAISYQQSAWGGAYLMLGRGEGMEGGGGQPNDPFMCAIPGAISISEADEEYQRHCSARFNKFHLDMLNSNEKYGL
jgi:hypothetical protein